MGDDLGSVMRRSFKLAESQNFPHFVGPERASTPINSSPYMVALSDVRNGKVLKRRDRLMTIFLRCVDTLSARGIEPVAALLGGSAIGPKPNPSDLDCVLFYRADRDSIRDFSWMASFERASKSDGLDVRLVPLDGDPVLLIKIASFFSTLYVKNAGEDRIVRGLVLVDCRG